MSVVQIRSIRSAESRKKNQENYDVQRSNPQCNYVEQIIFAFINTATIKKTLPNQVCGK
jgi:hypothetical protein